MDERSPPHRGRTWPRRLWRAARAGVLVWLGLALVLWAIQDKLIFPGAASQGTAEAQVVRLGEGEELRRLALAGGEAVLYVAPGRDAAGHVVADAPTLMLFYGNGSFLAPFKIVADDLAGRGVRVALLEYPGYGMSAGVASETSFREAALAAHDELAAAGGPPPIVAGVSLGGGVAIDLATRRQVAGVAVFSTFTELEAMARRVAPLLPVRQLLRHRFDNRRKLAELRVPTFIAHGTSDRLIPFEMAGELRAAAAGEVTWRPVEGAGHNDLFQTDPALFDDFIAWVQQTAAASR